VVQQVPHRDGVVAAELGKLREVRHDGVVEAQRAALHQTVAQVNQQVGQAWALLSVARARLDNAGFDFLSQAEEPESRSERLRRSGLDARALPALSAALVGVHAEADRRCGAGLTP
jgi:hypothetical protein